VNYELSGGNCDNPVNFTKTTTSNRLFLAILFSFLTVVGSGSVAHGDLLVAPNSVAGVLDDSANFAQKTFSETFSKGGKFSGKTIDEVADLLRKGDLKPSDVPLEYFTRRNGPTLISTTRSAEALRRAGIPRSQWHGVDISGDSAALRRLAGQLNRNDLWPNGIPNARPSGGQ
jgi:hypothetical protein